MSVLTACVTNLGKYNEGELAYFPLNLPATTEEVQAGLKRIGVDGVRYEELFITDYDSAKELINLVQNLDCYIFYPDIRDADDLGVYYVRSGALEVPEHLENYFDYEAYGRDIAMEEDGEFVDGGYILYGGSFTEVYSGREDIPDEHRIFAYPKLNIREQLTAFKEIADRAADVPAKTTPALAHSDR